MHRTVAALFSDKCRRQTVLTCGLVKGVASQSERDTALMTGEAAPMEELALSTDALQHIDPLTTEVTLLTVRYRR